MDFIFELDDEVLNIIERRRRPRVFYHRNDFFNFFDDRSFIVRFRLSKEVVMFILNQIEDLIKPPSHRNNAIPAVNRLLVALRFYATGNMLLTVADFAGISKTSACVILRKVSQAIGTLRCQYIRMPETREEILEAQTAFYEIARFPLTIGAIDCTHIRIQSPGGDQAEYFRNRKNFFSINTQTISDARLKILNVVARWPGSTHDSNIFDNSTIKTNFETGLYGNALLIGDSGYKCRKFLLTPLLNPNTPAERLYNESLIKTRNTVERQYGVLKRRFPVLYFEMRVSLQRVTEIIIATSILHNMAIDMNEEEAPPDPQVEIPNIDLNFDQAVENMNHNIGDFNTRQRFINEHFQQLLNNHH